MNRSNVDLIKYNGIVTPRPGTDPAPRGTREAFEVLSELAGLMSSALHLTMREYGLPGPSAHALAKMEGNTISMKELGQRIHCDPSLVTAIADALEDKGLARRQVDPADRRVKNLVLTARGDEARATLQREFYENLPGIRMLGEAERQAFIALLRKMIAAEKASDLGARSA